MKGGSRRRAMKNPLTRPHAAPVSSPNSIASGTGTAALTASAATTPDNARIEPTDRSMPPVMITQVAPIPR